MSTEQGIHVPGYLFETDPEVMLLCALLWNRATEDIDTVLDVLHREDFQHLTNRVLWDLIVAAHGASRPHDPGSVLSDAMRLGEDLEVPQSSVRKVLEAITTVGADPVFMRSYAEQIVTVAYRRQYVEMTQRLTDYAEKANEEALFSMMVEEGKSQRRAKNRLDDVRKALLNSSEKDTL